MAVRNGGPYLPEAIESVLGQSFSDFEFLIVDDASTDGTGEALCDYERTDRRIRVLRNERTLGPYPSANRALEAARGDIIARHDADDVSPPGRFSAQLAAFASREGVSLVTGQVEVFTSDTPERQFFRPPEWQPQLEWDLLFTNVIGAGGHVMFPRVLHGKPILFPSQHRYAEDYGLWCRLSGAGPVVCPTEIIYRYRRHSSSISAQSAAEQERCLSDIRFAHQSRYLTAGTSTEIADELSRFWTFRTQGFSRTFREIAATLDEIRSAFLDYVGARYGAADRARLDSHIEDALGQRLVHWLYHSVTGLDAHASTDVLAIARDHRQGLRVSGKTLARIGVAIRSKLSATSWIRGA
jgi:glycosyltransferase involved in cell wall biosynthesis